MGNFLSMFRHIISASLVSITNSTLPQDMEARQGTQNYYWRTRTKI
jgi:hypothetical protein